MNLLSTIFYQTWEEKIVFLRNEVTFSLPVSKQRAQKGKKCFCFDDLGVEGLFPRLWNWEPLPCASRTAELDIGLRQTDVRFLQEHLGSIYYIYNQTNEGMLNHLI